MKRHKFRPPLRKPKPPPKKHGKRLKMSHYYGRSKGKTFNPRDIWKRLKETIGDFI